MSPALAEALLRESRGNRHGHPEVASSRTFTRFGLGVGQAGFGDRKFVTLGPHQGIESQFPAKPLPLPPTVTATIYNTTPSDDPIFTSPILQSPAMPAAGKVHVTVCVLFDTELATLPVDVRAQILVNAVQEAEMQARWNDDTPTGVNVQRFPMPITWGGTVAAGDVISVTVTTFGGGVVRIRGAGTTSMTITFIPT